MSTESDYELLELAAKAAGIDHPGGDHCVNGPALWDCKLLRWWRPLHNDGDAFRLMVVLMIDLSQDSCGVNCIGLGQRNNYGSDGVLATYRRAIVRAAAEIGRRMISND